MSHQPNFVIPAKAGISGGKVARFFPETSDVHAEAIDVPGMDKGLPGAISTLVGSYSFAGATTGECAR